MSRGQAFIEGCYGLDTPDAVREFYDRHAGEYDDILVDDIGYVAPALSVDLLASHLPERTSRIVDLGCGTGLAAEALVRLGYAAPDGIDFAPRMLDVARAKGCYRALLQADLNRPLDLPDDAYDAALGVGAFGSVHVGVAALDEVVRIVRPGGVACIAINERAQHADGYAAAYEAMAAGGRIEILSLGEHDYHRRLGIRGWICVFRVRPAPPG